MGKNKDKKVNKSSKSLVSEDALLKSLNELEEAVLKSGDELLEQDPEGGLSTEGEPLSKKAPKGKGGDVAKADDGSDENSDDDDVEKGGDEESDEESEEDASEDDASEEDESSDEPPMPMKKNYKSVKKGDKTSKSLRERADDDETMQKAIEVSEFIEAMVDQTSEALADLQKSFDGELSTVNDRLEKSEAYQRNFNGRLAKGLIDIGKVLVATQQMVKALTDKPNPQMRKSVLSASEIEEPSRSGDDGSAQHRHEQVAEWLFEKSMAGEIDSLLVTQFEVHRSVDALPPQVRKALNNDLRK